MNQKEIESINNRYNHYVELMPFHDVYTEVYFYFSLHFDINSLSSSTRKKKKENEFKRKQVNDFSDHPSQVLLPFQVSVFIILNISFAVCCVCYIHSLTRDF